MQKNRIRPAVRSTPHYQDGRWFKAKDVAAIVEFGQAHVAATLKYMTCTGELVRRGGRGPAGYEYCRTDAPYKPETQAQHLIVQRWDGRLQLGECST